MKNKILSKRYVLEVLSKWVLIPVERLDARYFLKENLLQFMKKLKEILYGQNEAIETCHNVLKRRFLLSEASQDEMRPISTLLFVGGSGTGKTGLAIQISNYFFGGPQHLIRIDCGNYTEEHSISKLLGSPPGYVGYGQGGQLTNALRKNNVGVILFDEVEKAHPKIITDVLIELASSGTITDGNTGTLIDATNTIVILTSNLGTSFDQYSQNEVGFLPDSESEDNSQLRIQKAIRSFFPNEILGRIDEIIIFNRLNDESINQIWDKELKKLEEKLITILGLENSINGIKIALTDTARQSFLNKVMVEVKSQGTRAIQRVFNHWITDQITELIAEGKIVKGQSCVVIIDKDESNNFYYSIKAD